MTGTPSVCAYIVSNTFYKPFADCPMLSAKNTGAKSDLQNLRFSI